MIQIVRGTLNRVALSLSERVTLSEPHYLFRFKSESSREIKLFIAHDISLYPERANVFNITESATEIPLSGTVHLIDRGFWKYEIWEQVSSTNLNPQNTTTLLETGIVNVIGTEENNFTQYGSAATEYKQYTG